jgi:hypothetical protein
MSIFIHLIDENKNKKRRKIIQTNSSDFGPKTQNQGTIL